MYNILVDLQFQGLGYNKQIQTKEFYTTETKNIKKTMVSYDGNSKYLSIIKFFYNLS